MKINNFGTHRINPYKRQMNKLDELKKAEKPVDKVEISSTAKAMQQLSDVEQQRAKKVEELKIQVENGTYKPNPQEIAKSIANFYSKK
ncbi:flagellar biosynthesis anti-sigma factor FlgM [Heyndrickxia sp. MSNUG]|uniref:flagellar biosynthesis anti-sigma factor FlgM n=1 Tax=Heyndrickxia sp. MSNUG TaxID=3136677 RepID=UPI003C2FCBBA